MVATELLRVSSRPSFIIDSNDASALESIQTVLNHFQPNIDESSQQTEPLESGALYNVVSAARHHIQAKIEESKRHGDDPLK